MRFFITIFILFFVFSFYPIRAQYKAKIWDTRDGLSNNWVSDITQDDRGYIWLATQYGLNRFDGYAFDSFTHNPENSNSPVANWVKRIARKSKKELWLGVDYGGLDLYHIDANRFDHKAVVQQGDIVTTINELLSSKNSFLYVATDRGLFREVGDGKDLEQLFKEKVIDIKQNSKGQIFFLSNSAIYTYDSQFKSVKKVFENRERSIKNIFIDSKDRLFSLYSGEIVMLQSSNGIYTILKSFKIDNSVSLRFADTPITEDSKQQIWIGGEKGISIVSKNRSSVEFHPYHTFFEKNIIGIQALSFFEDVHENMWMGTNKGVALISTFKTRFRSDHMLPNSSNFNDIRAFHSVNGSLLIAADEGLFSTTRKKGIKKILSKKIYGIHSTNSGKLYAIGWGLFEIDTASFEVKTISSSYFKGGWSIAEDKKENLWVVANKNLIRYHKDSLVFERFNKDNSKTLHDPPRIDLLVDSAGRLWLCTLKSGIYILENPHELPIGATPVFTNINHETGNKNSLSNRLATSLLEASDGTIWVGTDAGLNAVNPKTFEVKRYLKSDGLIDEKIMAITEDNQGNIWGSTVGNGIFQLNPKTDEFNFFGMEDGLISNNFLLSSVYKNPEGILFFGSDSGIQEINPVLFETFSHPKINFFFTSVQLPLQSDNNEAKVLDTQSGEITLDYENNSFVVNYTTLNYHLAEKTRYKYKLKNLHNTWQNNGNNRSITFNSLPAGEYHLDVTAINPDLDFTNELIRLKLIVRPPWWQTNLAYITYFLLLSSLLFGIHKYVLKGKLERAEKIRLQELDTFKTNFFNNVAHELKTPLTLIAGMAKTLDKKGTKEIKKSVKTIIRNSDELNDLVNQILDLSKLEVGKLEIDMAHGNIIIYLKYIMDSFESLASAKEIRLHFLTLEEKLEMDFDAQKVKHIFSNLISNAIKNTPVKGDVYLQVMRQDTHSQFVVKDNGIGISEKELQLIFERYHQVQGQTGGTGIGLSFTKELVELMNGTITVESTEGKGTSFAVSLPIEHRAPNEISFEGLPETTNPNINNPFGALANTSDKYPMIQIIEDNLDICSYLSFILGQDYRLNFSHSGDLGLENVFETLPDLVITDLMMPGKDGYEVCHEIKSNIITDHIPVIMLTAKSDIESKLEGLKIGADVYLEKPFNERELSLRISKLLEQRAKLRQKYRDPNSWDGEIAINDGKTNEFVLKVRALIETNIDDSNFGILELCRSLGISRSHLHRKLKSLTDLSTSAFIQTVKLQKGHDLLKNSKLNVSEVAYEIGFEDPAYFSRLFSKTYGYPPSETRKNL